MFPHVEVTKYHFERKTKELLLFLRKKSWKGEDRKNYVESFSRASWNKFDVKIRVQHSLHNCVLCDQNYSLEQSKFPKMGVLPKKRLHLDPTTTQSTPKRQAEQDVHITIPVSRNNLGVMKTAASSILTNVNEEWDKVYDIPFTQVLTKIPSIGLQEKEIDSQKKKNLRKVHKKIKTGVEKVWQNNDVVSYYGTRQSKASYMTSRAKLSFESKIDAVKRNKQPKGI